MGKYRTNRMSPPGLSLVEKVAWFGYDEELVVPDLGPCHIWRGGKSGNGYGVVSWMKRNVIVNRIILDIIDSPSIQACHHCDNPPCINPKHLFAGTRSDNMKDKVAKGRHVPYPGEGKSEGSRNRLAALKAKRTESS